MIDRPRLIKLMMMTTSSNDGEALVALRKANAMLKEGGLSWQDFINGIRQQPLPRPPRPPPRPQGRGVFETGRKVYIDPEIPRMIRALLRDVKGDFRRFVESVDDYWNEHGHLTQSQYEGVINAFERMK